MKNPYWLHPEQASLIALDALALGIPREHIDAAIKLANRGYTLGYGDKAMGRGHNSVYYDPQEMLRGLVVSDKMS